MAGHGGSGKKEIEMGKRVSVVAETNTGRNERFRDNLTGIVMTRAEFVRKIEGGVYDRYHVRVLEGVKTPVSNPDASERNNLG